MHDWNAAIGCLPLCTGVDAFSTYYDRSFDLRYQIVEEGRFVPAIAVGLQDFVGTGLLAGEYLVATKNVLPGLKVTAGLGWGRLGSHGAIGSPFGVRDPVVVGTGGTVNAGQWFRGPAAPFGGFEWAISDVWTAKAEYSSDAYAEESGLRGTFDRKSSLIVGIEYQPNPNFRLGAYHMYGSEFGLAMHVLIDPKRRPTVFVLDGAPEPVKPRPSRQSDPEAYDRGWVSQPSADTVLLRNLNRRLDQDGLEVEAIGNDGVTARVRVVNVRYDATSQVIGRVARAMANVLPASVEVFEILPVVNGIPAARVTVRRSDLESLEYASNATEAMRARVGMSDAGTGASAGLTYDPERFPRFTWSLAPYFRASYFDPDQPIRADVGARLSLQYDLAPGVVLSGAIAKRLAGNLSESTRISDSVLPHVRSDAVIYDREGDPSIEYLNAAWYFRPGRDLYGRVTAGYLESMYAGVSAEMLWKPVDSRFALGVEVNYARQRDFDQLFKLRDYDVITGHVSGYYEFAEGFHAQLDVGRYLAGDVGATLTLTREFENGWRIGAFATRTDVSAAEFGEGSFDKGITLSVPLTWGLGTPSARSVGVTLRPVLRDGGARLGVGGRLYESVRGYHVDGLDDQWARFWK